MLTLDDDTTTLVGDAVVALDGIEAGQARTT